jgi:hypothetical protein
MNTCRTLIRLIACVALSFAAGCADSSVSAPTTKPTDVGPTYISPVSASTPTTIDGVGYEYVATAERERQIVDGFPKLKVGQSREEVRDAMGLPDTAQPGYSKEYNSRFLGWSYLYRIRMRSGGPNTNDVCVEVFFDSAGNLMRAVPNHIAGLKEVGGPASP